MAQNKPFANDISTGAILVSLSLEETVNISTRTCHYQSEGNKKHLSLVKSASQPIPVHAVADPGGGEDGGGGGGGGGGGWGGGGAQRLPAPPPPPR